MDEGSFLGSVRKFGVWIGRRKNDIRRILPSHGAEGEAVAPEAFPADFPIDDVMGPIDYGTGDSVSDGGNQRDAKCSNAGAPEASEEDKVGLQASPPESQDDTSVGNGRLVRVLEDVVCLQDEIDRMRKGLDDESSSALEHIGFRLEEIIDRSGATPIKGDRIFDIRRHRPAPMAMVKDGTPIEETIRAGWREGDRVLRRATVKVGSV